LGDIAKHTYINGGDDDGDHGFPGGSGVYKSA
jgi:hypothetical protein